MNRIVIALLKPFSFIPAILMMSMIFSFSSQNGTESSQLSEKVARGIFITIDHIMDRGWDDEKIQELADEYQYPVRKLAHMTEYCLLAICVSLPLYVYGLRGFALTFLAGILCVAFAASDEFHQTMVANRGPSVKDVGIDSIGVLFGITFVRLFCWIALGGNTKKRKRRRRLCHTIPQSPRTERLTSAPALPMRTGNDLICMAILRKNCIGRSWRRSARLRTPNSGA